MTERDNNAPHGTARAADGSYCLLDDLGMDEAVAIATRNHNASGHAPMTPDQVAAARDKAQDLLKGGMTADGMRDLRLLTLSLGMPAAKLSLKQLVDFGVAPDPVKISLKASIEKVSDLTEHGCQEIRFFNKAKGKEDKAYLLLDECPADHNLTAQLDRLAPHIPPAKRPKIMEHLSVLLYIGRSVFATVAKDNQSLLTEILKYVPASDRLDISGLHVDPSNSTLCIHPRAPNRVGIYVRFASETEPADRTASVGTAPGPQK